LGFPFDKLRDRARFQVEEEGRTMEGMITKKDLFFHPLLIIGLFGLRVYLRGCAAGLIGRKTTFLAIAFDTRRA
jgi:hypothetical protein